MQNRDPRMGRKRKGYWKCIWEAENFPNVKKETYPATGSTEGPKQGKTKQTYTKIIIKMAKVKERILKAAREKEKVNYKGTPT